MSAESISPCAAEPGRLIERPCVTQRRSHHSSDPMQPNRQTTVKPQQGPTAASFPPRACSPSSLWRLHSGCLLLPCWPSEGHVDWWHPLRPAAAALVLPNPVLSHVLGHLSRLWLFAVPRTIAHQAAQTAGFSRPEYESGLPCPPPGDLGLKPASLMSPALAGTFFTTSATWETHLILGFSKKKKKKRRRRRRKKYQKYQGWGDKDKGNGEEDRAPQHRQKKGESGDRGDCLWHLPWPSSVYPTLSWSRASRHYPPKPMFISDWMDRTFIGFQIFTSPRRQSPSLPVKHISLNS